MFRRLVFWLVGLPAAIVMIVLAVANRKPVSLSFDPTALDTPLFSIEAPLYVFLFAAVFAGILIGWVFAWAGQGKWRRRARQKGYEAHALAREIKQFKEASGTHGSSLALPKS